MDFNSAVTNFKMVQEFHKAFNVKPTAYPMTNWVLRNKLLHEEFNELDEALWDFASAEEYVRDVEVSGQQLELFPDAVSEDYTAKKRALAKELADLLYVTYGTADIYGIDLDSVFEEVHRSNMSKLGEDGKPVYREDGKVLKGPNYHEPDLSFVE